MDVPQSWHGSGKAMISAIDYMDVDEATATTLDTGVVFRLPYADAGVLMLASRGYARSPPTMRQVSVDGLREAAGRLDFFGYRGCDLQYHYFAMPRTGGLRVPLRDLSLDRLPVTLGLCLFVAFRGQELTIPDPIHMTGIDPAQCQWALAW